MIQVIQWYDLIRLTKNLYFFWQKYLYWGQKQNDKVFS